jgi:single-strand DNA-binding protein
MNVNRVMLIGRLDGDPVLRETRDRKAYCTFRLATTKTMQRGDVTSWHSVTIWNELGARFIATYAENGSTICVEGELNYRLYEKEGVKVTAAEIHVNNMDSFIVDGWKSKEDRAAPPASQRGRTYGEEKGRPAAGARGTPPAIGTSPDLDDEIPF